VLKQHEQNGIYSQKAAPRSDGKNDMDTVNNGSAHQGCPFCSKTEADMLFHSGLVFAVYDENPVSPGHVLICTRRHTASFFDATGEEKSEILAAVDAVRDLLDREYRPDGYNIGVNCGEAAGQSIGHLHVHVIPRYKGDMERPKGGVRGVIPEKQGY